MFKLAWRTGSGQMRSSSGRVLNITSVAISAWSRHQ